MALFNNVVPFSLITVAQEEIESSLAATLVGTMPLFTLVFAWALATEPPSAERAAGLIVGFIGAVVVIGPDLGDVTESSTLAQFAVLGASMSYAIATVVARRYAQGPPMSLAAGQFVIGATVAVILAAAVDGAPPDDVPARALAAALALGVLSSGLAYIVFFGLIQRITATQASLVSYIIPIVATVLGWVVLDEAIGPNLFVGLALILAGVLIVNGGLRAARDRVRGQPRPDAEMPPAVGG
jgi:drug/metabolite transporter (DMT)-like permease